MITDTWLWSRLEGISRARSSSTSTTTSSVVPSSKSTIEVSPEDIHQLAVQLNDHFLSVTQSHEVVAVDSGSDKDKKLRAMTFLLTNLRVENFALKAACTALTGTVEALKFEAAYGLLDMDMDSGK